MDQHIFSTVQLLLIKLIKICIIYNFEYNNRAHNNIMPNYELNYYQISYYIIYEIIKLKVAVGS